MIEVKFTAELPAATPFAPFGEEGEAIYALMLTGKDNSRIAFARNAICSFLSQTHPNRYLIIVNDGDYRFIFDGLFKDRIRELNTPRMILGDLRNYAMDAVPPDGIWIQWDDDDWHHPEAMAAQWKQLRERNLDACTIMAQIKVDIKRNSAWHHRLPEGFNGFAGTVMARRKIQVRYPSVRAHEDSAYWREVHANWKAHAVDVPFYHYLRLIHPNNTSEHLNVERVAADTWNLDEPAYSYLASVSSLIGLKGPPGQAGRSANPGPLVYA